jgi:hypothetical protein
MLFADKERNFMNQANYRLSRLTARSSKTNVCVALLLFAFLTVGAEAQVVSPIKANPNDGTVVPLQCLGCFASGSFYVKTTDPNTPEREPQMGDFRLSAPPSYEIRRPATLNGQRTADVTFVSSNLDSLYFFEPRDSQAGINYIDRSLQTSLYGFFLKPDVTFRGAYKANGVCDGPILNVAKEFVYDSGSTPLPLKKFDNVLGITLFTGLDNRSVSTQPSLGSILTDRFLICFGELADAKVYYDALQSKQVTDALAGFKQNTTREQIEKYVKSAVQEHLATAEADLTARIVRLTIEALKKQGALPPPAPPQVR